MDRTEPIRILCVDDEPVIAQALEARIATLPDLAWSGWLDRADGLVAEAARRNPDIVLVDLEMPGRDPFAVIADLRARQPRLRCLVLSAYVSADLVERALEAGAWGYVAKDDPPDTLFEAVRRVVGGHLGLGPAAADVFDA